MANFFRYPGEEPDPPCDVCGRDPSCCLCPECPACGVSGDPDCYKEGGHGMVRCEAQTASKREADDAAMRDAEADAAFDIESY